MKYFIIISCEILIFLVDNAHISFGEKHPGRMYGGSVGSVKNYYILYNQSYDLFGYLSIPRSQQNLTMHLRMFDAVV